MTREEAISVLENKDVSLGVAERTGQDPEYWRKLKPARDMAISALRAQKERICAGQYMDTLKCVFGGQCIGPDCPGFEPVGIHKLEEDV